MPRPAQSATLAGMGIFGRSGELSYDDLLNRITELERRVAMLERAGHGSAPAPAPAHAPQAGAFRPAPADHYGHPAVSNEVRHLAAEGQKIQAIKRLREETGLGLREAKDMVDRL